MRGDGFSAPIDVAPRALTKAAFTDCNDGLRLSASMFFVVASSICIASFVAHRYIIVWHTTFEYQSLPKNDIEDRPLAENGNLEARREHSQIAGLFSVAGGVDAESGISRRFHHRLCHSGNLPCASCGSRGDPSALPSRIRGPSVQNAALGDWYGVMLVAFFSIGDFAARQFPDAWLLTQSNTVIVFVLLRLLSIPISYSVARFCSVHLRDFPLNVINGERLARKVLNCLRPDKDVRRETRLAP